MAKSKPKKAAPKKAGKTTVTFLLDRTGSMQMIKDDTIGAFNTYLEGLKKGKTSIDFTLVTFDSMGLEKVCVREPVAKVPELTKETYMPRAMTPLIDAAYKTIKAVEASVQGEKVVICIQTDGEENASTQHTWDELNALIKEKSKLGWQFNFMGAGIDAYKQASRMGISRMATMSYDASDRVKTLTAFKASASNTSAFASGSLSNTNYTSLQKAASGDKFDPDTKKVKVTTKTKTVKTVRPVTPIVDDLKL